MPEVGNMGLPPKLLQQGITDMVRISDARMSGTAYGTVVLHTAPEAATGGPIAVVRNGDMIELDVPNRRLQLDISDTELATRLVQWQPQHEHALSGYAWLHQQHVQGADTGADFDFLKRLSRRSSGKGFSLIKVALVGIGKIAIDQHAPAITNSSEWELSATVLSSW